jgi:hypothetical protein
MKNDSTVMAKGMSPGATIDKKTVCAKPPAMAQVKKLSAVKVRSNPAKTG